MIIIGRFSFISLILFASCSMPKPPATPVVSREVMADSIPGSCPYLTTDSKGNVVLSWVRQTDSTKAVYCYATSSNGGASFSRPVEIPSTSNIHPHAENLPKIIFQPSGQAIAVWGEHSPDAKNPYAGLVFYAQSPDGGKSWGPAKRLVNDPSAVDQRYFDIAITPDGEAAIIWLDSRKPGKEEGSSLYFAKTSGNNGFTGERRISGPCCECCRTDLFVDAGKNVHVLYRAILNDSIRDMVHSVSADDGKTFSSPQKISNDNWVIDGCPHTGPAMAENNEGLHFTWFTAGNGTGVFYNQSNDNGASFSNRMGLSGNTGRHPQITKLPDGEIGIVWDENFKTGLTYCSRIGFEIASHSVLREKKYITPGTLSATFPVITTWNDNALIAYTGNANSRNHIFYQQIGFKN